MFEYKVRCRHKLGWKEIKLYADTDIEEFFNRNSIDYVRNMTDTVEHRQLKEIERLKELCDRYEEEHSNEFKKWQEETGRINKAIEYIENYINQFNGVYPIADMRYLDLHKLLDILKGVDKE